VTKERLSAMLGRATAHAAKQAGRGARGAETDCAGSPATASEPSERSVLINS
jgi:hypothetical protein